VATYYLVAESLTDTAKPTHASEIRVASKPRVRTFISRLADDGVGGANVGNGSGRIGLIDRVEALGGDLEISSDVGLGTSLIAEIPLEVE
jgi:signal transduction histidine kinase